MNRHQRLAFRRFKKNLIIALPFLFLIVAYLVVGTMEYNDCIRGAICP